LQARRCVTLRCAKRDNFACIIYQY
jgi:hypothetical protein